MKITAKLTLGNSEYIFEIDERDEMDALHKAVILTNPKSKCDSCGNTDVTTFRFDTNKDREGNTYNSVLCRKCGAKSSLGRYKTGGYFWKPYEKYMKTNPGTNNAPAQKAPEKPAFATDSFSGDWA